MSASPGPAPAPEGHWLAERRYGAYAELGWHEALRRDVVAGVSVALVSIPLGQGVALACHLRPEVGVLAGAIAGTVGALVGGTRHQAYGPSAALLPVVAALVLSHGHPFMLLCILLAGLLLVLLGFARLGSWLRHVPQSVVLGFTLGIAISLGLGQLPWMLGLKAPALPLGGKLLWVVQHLNESQGLALGLSLLSLALLWLCARLGPFVPGPLVAVGMASALQVGVLGPYGLPTVGHLMGEGGALWVWPALGQHSPWALVGPVISLALIVALESLLSARVAQRLAQDEAPLQADRELLGQGLGSVANALLGCMPTSGALARTVVNLRCGAVSPLASFVKAVVMAASVGFAGPWVAVVPLASVGGLLFYVAWSMAQPSELRLVWGQGRAHLLLMAYTLVCTLAFDLAWAVLSALALYGLWAWWARALTSVPSELG